MLRGFSPQVLKANSPTLSSYVPPPMLTIAPIVAYSASMAEHEHEHAPPPNESVHDHHQDGPEVATAVLETLDAQGLRMTGPRRALVEALVERQEAFTAEELMQAVPAVGRATVFRTIKLLVDSGLVCRMSQVDGRPLYSLSHQGHHHHALCQRCGAVLDIYRCGIDTMLENIELSTGAKVLGHRLEVFVLCPACVAAAGESPPAKQPA